MKKKYFITLIIMIFAIAFMGMLNKVNAADVEITFKDENLFRIIRDKYSAIVSSTDSENLKVVISEENIAKTKALDLTGSLPTLSWPGEHRIKDLSGIEKFTALTDVTLDQNLLTDITPLANLDLRLLYLRKNTQLTDVSIVQNFPNLEQLSLDSCNISQDNIEAISKCTNLKNLSLHGNKNVTDISALSSLTKLCRLWIGRTPITSIEVLKNFTLLKELFIYQNRNIESLDVLKNLTELEGLYCYSCSISDISPLSNLTKLVTLRIDDNNIEDISTISNLTNLVALNASSNRISDSTPVEGREWKGLDLSNQRISLNAKAGSTITLPEIFRATLDSSNVMYIPNDMTYSNCEKVDTNSVKLGNSGEISVITIGKSNDIDKSFSWEYEYVANNLNAKVIKSAQGSRLTITLEDSSDGNSGGSSSGNSNSGGGSSSSSTNGKIDPTTSSNILPNTGKEILVFASLIALGITSFIFVKKYNKYKKI